MSQKKVDAYKARKGQHNKADKKEKMLFGLEMFAWVFICVVIVAWIGYSAYVKVAGTKAEVVQNTVLDTSALDNYISGIDTDEDHLQYKRWSRQQKHSPDGISGIHYACLCDDYDDGTVI